MWCEPLSASPAKPRPSGTGAGTGAASAARPKPRMFGLPVDQVTELCVGKRLPLTASPAFNEQQETPNLRCVTLFVRVRRARVFICLLL